MVRAALHHHPQTPPPGDWLPVPVGDSESRKRRPMPKVSKNRAKADELFDRAKKYTVDQAVGFVKKAKFAKFDETVDLAVGLGVNPKHADQMVRGALVLPRGTGQTVRVQVAAKGEKEREARE